MSVAHHLEFVGHACLVHHLADIQLITDPWIEGKVFDQGWAHLSTPGFTYADFERITHIWFSHEHPDHFFPPNIKKIAPEHRKNITVLFQKTTDKKVLHFCQKLGFKEVIELAPFAKTALMPGVQIQCGVIGHDSWLLVENITENGTMRVLNTNDCILNEEAVVSALAHKLGPVHLLITQFSYASWAGIDADARRKSAQRKLEQMALQIQQFQPSHVIPFASYVHFCHEENQYLNDSVNRIREVAGFLQKQGVQPIVMYPGMQWLLTGAAAEQLPAWDNAEALARYETDITNLSAQSLTASVAYNPAQLMADAGEFMLRCRKKLPWVYRKFYLKQSLKHFPLIVHVPEHQQTYRTVKQGLKPVPIASEEADFSMSAEALAYCFRFDWGFDTTFINGRFILQKPKGMKAFNRFISIGNTLNHAESSFKILLRAFKKKLA